MAPSDHEEEWGANQLSIVVPTATPEAFAQAIGTDPSNVTHPAPSRHMGTAFEVKNGHAWFLNATTSAPGAENVYWTRLS